MQSNHARQSLVQGIVDTLATVDQVIQPGHEHLQLPAGVHREESRQAARGHGDVVGDEAGQQLDKVEDLVDGATASVDDHSGHREHQSPVGHVPVLVDDLGASERHRHEVEQNAAVHEEAANDHQPTTEIGVLQHDPPVLLMPHVPPIALDVLDASANIVLAKDQNAVLHHGHHEETESAAELQLVVEVLDLQDNEHERGNQQHSQQPVAAYIQHSAIQRLDPGVIRGSRPRADRLESPDVQLHADPEVVLVIPIVGPGPVAGAGITGRTLHYCDTDDALRIERVRETLVLVAMMRACANFSDFPRKAGE